MKSAEETQIRRFVSGQLRDCPDLSTLTLGILRGRYLACVGRDSLNQEDRQLMKRVVEEELLRMQVKMFDSDSSDNEAIIHVTPTPLHNKRKRGKEEEKGGRTKADGSKAKRSRLQSAQSDSPDSGLERVGNGERQMAEEEEGKVMGSVEQVSQIGTKKNKGGHKGVHNGGKTETSSESDVEIKTVNRRKSEHDSEVEEEDFEENKKWKRDETHKQEKDKVNSESDSEEDKKRAGGKENVDVKVQNETEEVMTKTKDEPAQDSDSGSSLPSLEDEQESEVRPEQVKKRKSVAKRPIKGESGSKGGKDNTAVARLKRYIALCGVRRNYKKLLDGCCSIKSKVAVLKRELEELGVEGQPSIERCKKARLKREEAQELADLDVCNIITTQGRPKRRGVSIWQQQSSPPSSAYKRVVNSSSDSEEDSHAGRGRKRATDWSNLQGIISDDADSN
ncbi:HIRA-interacting protein 3 isoform X4 [Oncorhynchus tshawytscha]|uniref:HIRA-interacting protein 3 isoform X4 n=1 Tax=Oncorhynchus tshawytscha TaxID=74940 RepID=UPI000D09DE17|nr:HIRA-interacting protein 3 isoform X4 [Oncorhynchus tshawytscha]